MLGRRARAKPIVINKNKTPLPQKVPKRLAQHQKNPFARSKKKDDDESSRVSQDEINLSIETASVQEVPDEIEQEKEVKEKSLFDDFFLGDFFGRKIKKEQKFPIEDFDEDKFIDWVLELQIFGRLLSDPIPEGEGEMCSICWNDVYKS